MASSAVSSAVQQVGSLLANEAKFLYDVKGKIDSLKIELEWMECFLEDADSRQHKEKLVRKWVAQITDFAYEAEDLLERYFHQLPQRRDTGIWNTIKWFSNLLRGCHVRKLHDLGSDIENMTIRIAELTSRLQRYGVKLISPAENMAYNAMMREERRTYSHVEEEAIGLEQDVKKVVEKLTKTQVKVVSIAGMGGLGKSTLARKVFQDKAIKEHFRNYCVWVYISKDCKEKIVFEEILSGLSSVYEGVKNPSADVCTKIKELLQEKKCFVVLDDIWTTEAWDSLKQAFLPFERSASKILLTTRDEGLQKHVDPTGYSHPLKLLSLDDSWKLLQHKAFPQKRRAGNEEATSTEETKMENGTVTLDVAEYTEMEKLGKEMLKHCGGLPLAIVALGGILSTKRTSSEWEEVKRNLSTHLMTDTGNGSETGRVLELSYNALPFYLKPCFLYLASFPEDHKISTERLYHLWEAEGLLETPDRDETGVDDVPSCFQMGEKYLLELIQRCVVQAGKRSKRGRIKTCMVHDLMRDLCIKKCKEASFLNVQKVITERTLLRRHALHLKDGRLDVQCFPQHGRKAACVRSLLAFQLKGSESSYFEREDLLNMVKCFPLLRVLDLEDANIGIKVLEVGHLIHLKYLNLRSLGVAKVASCIVDLKYLATLDLRHVEHRDGVELPNKFHRMKRLRHLYLPLTFSVKNKEKLSFRGLQIETLKNFHPMKCEMKDLRQMTSLRGFSIPYFDFVSKKDLELLAETPLVQSELQVCSVRLEIEDGKIFEDPDILTSVFKGNKCFVKLKFDGCWNALEKMSSAIASGLHVFPDSLTRLDIEDCELSRDVILVLEKLPHLQVLILQNVDTGRKITFSAGSFPRLHFLSLWTPNLEEWEVGDKALPILQRLELVWRENFKKLPEGLPQSVHIELL